MSARSKEQTKLPEADLENVDAYMARAEAFMKMHRPEDAAHQLDLAIAKFGSSEILFAMRGGARFNHVDYRDAAADFSAAIGYNSQRAYYFIMRGLSRSLFQPPEVEGACADLEMGRRLGYDIRDN